MLAVTINLIHNSERYKKVAKYTYYGRIGAYVALFVLIIVNFVLFIGKTTVQKKVEELTNQYQSFLTTNSKLTASTAKVAYTYSKLKKINELIASSPEYYKQYEYLLSTILANSDVQVEDMSFDGKNGSILSISSSNASELLAVLARIEEETSKKTFSLIILNSFAITSQKKENSAKIYSANLSFKFTNVFDEKNN